MDLSERAHEDVMRHPWEMARADFFIGLLRRDGLIGGANWLDVGAGDAWFASQLLRECGPHQRVTAWDAFYAPEDLEDGTRDPRLSLVVDQPALRFDRVLLMDVIEHVSDDRSFVTSIVRDNLDDAGVVLVTVPAYNALFSEHDVALSHYRRYSPRQCRALLEACGLRVIREGGLFHGLLVARAVGVAAQRFRRRLRGRRRHVDATASGVGTWNGGRLVTATINGALRAEGRASSAIANRGRVLPGLSYWALCDKGPSGA